MQKKQRREGVEKRKKKKIGEQTLWSREIKLQTNPLVSTRLFPAVVGVITLSALNELDIAGPGRKTKSKSFAGLINSGFSSRIASTATHLHNGKLEEARRRTLASAYITSNCLKLCPVTAENTRHVRQEPPSFVALACEDRLAICLTEFSNASRVV